MSCQFKVLFSATPFDYSPTNTPWMIFISISSYCHIAIYVRVIILSCCHMRVVALPYHIISPTTTVNHKAPETWNLSQVTSRARVKYCWAWVRFSRADPKKLPLFVICRIQGRDVEGFAVGILHLLCCIFLHWNRLLPNVLAQEGRNFFLHWNRLPNDPRILPTLLRI